VQGRRETTPSFYQKTTCYYCFFLNHRAWKSGIKETDEIWEIKPRKCRLHRNARPSPVFVSRQYTLNIRSWNEEEELYRRKRLSCSYLAFKSNLRFLQRQYHENVHRFESSGSKTGRQTCGSAGHGAGRLIANSHIYDCSATVRSSCGCACSQSVHWDERRSKNCARSRRALHGSKSWEFSAVSTIVCRSSNASQSRLHATKIYIKNMARSCCDRVLHVGYTKYLCLNDSSKCAEKSTKSSTNGRNQNMMGEEGTSVELAPTQWRLLEELLSFLRPFHAFVVNFQVSFRLCALTVNCLDGFAINWQRLPTLLSCAHHKMVNQRA